MSRLICLVGMTIVMAVTRTGCGSDDWPTWRHDSGRSGVTEAKLEVQRLRKVWEWKSPIRPRTAWPGPAKWDAYANLKNLIWMRDYDAAFHPIVASDRVYFGSSVDDSLRCLSLADGSELWHQIVDGPIRSTPTWSQGRVYFSSDDGRAYCHDATTGAALWSYSPPETQDTPWVLHNGRVISRWPCRTGVLIADGTAYCGFALFPWQPSYFCALDAETGKPTGFKRFVAKSQGETFEGPLLATQDTLVAARGRIEPALISRTDGQIRGKLTGGGGSFLTTSSDGKLWHGPGNKTGWLTQSELPAGKKVSEQSQVVAVTMNESFACFVGHHRITARERSSGNVLWQTGLQGAREVILVGSVAFVGGTDRVSAYDVSSGGRLWTAEVNGTVESLAAVDHTLLAATDSGSIICFQHSVTDQGSPKPSTDSSLEAGAANEKPLDADSDTSTQTTKELPGLIHDWDFRAGMDAHAIRRGLADAESYVPDTAGSLSGKILGTRSLWQGGGIEALALDGQTSVELTSDLSKAKLPKQAFSAEAWVKIESPLEWGGIVGAVRDNGADEQGWLLGYRKDRLSFAIRAKGGPNSLTYLLSPKPFDRQHWHHVVGTYDGRVQKLFVDGKLVAESSAQTGDIQYPPKGWAVIGAYRDENEFFKMSGMIHRVCIFDRALDPSEITQRFTVTRAAIPQTTELALGPWITYPAPNTAVVHWETESPVATRLRWRAGNQQGIVQDDELTQRHHARLNQIRSGVLLDYSIEVNRVNGPATTDTFTLDPDFNYNLPAVSADSISPATRNWSQAIANLTQSESGLVVVVGSVSAEQVLALSEGTRSFVRHIDTSQESVTAFRDELHGLFGYGCRFNSQYVPVSSWPNWPKDSASVVIVSPKFNMEAETIARLQKWVRPSGHLIIDDSQLPQTNGNDWQSLEAGEEELRIWQRPAVGEAGNWTHLYATPNNSGFSGETLQGNTSPDQFEVQWIGLPGPRAQSDRSGRKPSPLAINGRLFVQGLERIVAIDAYNGTILWECEIPGFSRFNMPRDCSNWCADGTRLYLAVRNRCWVIDAELGTVLETRKVDLPGGESSGYDWGYVARSESLLIGTAVKSTAPFRDFWGGYGWYDARSGPETDKVCADRLFAQDAKSGELYWFYERGVIVQSTLTIDGDTIYFVECRDPQIKASPLRRLGDQAFWKSQYLVAMNRANGEVLWERPLDPTAGQVAYFLAASKDRLITVASSAGTFHVSAFDAKDGKTVWQSPVGWPGGKSGDHGKALSRPAIVGDRVFVRPDVFSISDGKKLDLKFPYGKCGTYSCSTEMFFFRNSNVSAWSPKTSKLSGWARLRPDCWVSTLPALGMVLSPEAGGGCSCGFWFEASVGFAPKQGLPLPR